MVYFIHVTCVKVDLSVTIDWVHYGIMSSQLYGELRKSVAESSGGRLYD